MDLNSFILFPVDEVEKTFREKGYDVQLIENNFKIEGDRKLVTNIVICDNVCKIYYGQFVFDNLKTEK